MYARRHIFVCQVAISEDELHRVPGVQDPSERRAFIVLSLRVRPGIDCHGARPHVGVSLAKVLADKLPAGQRADKRSPKGGGC
jgi:hypothetical protein